VGLLDAVAAMSSFGLAVAVFAARSSGWIDLSYNPFAGLTAPPFEMADGLLMFVCGWPAARLLLAPRAAAVEQAALVPGTLNA
jgi:hypothetical protein